MSNKSDTTAELFLDAGRRMKKKLLAVEDGISFTQTEVLRFVYERDAPVMRDIADYLEISAPSATALVNQLARGGYLTRESNANDRRQVRLKATRKAVGELSSSMNKRKKIVSALLHGLSDKDHADMQRVLLKMLRNK